MAMTRKMIWVDEEDKQAIAIIKQRYGCESESQAWRMAARWLASANRVSIKLPPVSKHSKTKKTPKDLAGSWAGAFPPDYDIQGVLREIRSEWEKEWTLTADGKLEFAETRAPYTTKKKPSKRSKGKR